MHRFVASALLLALSLVAASAFPHHASAQAPREPASPEYLAHVGRGLVAMGAGDRVGAMTAFQQAVQLQPARPEAVCHLAEVARISGELPRALEGYQACLRTARDAGDARWTARGLHGVASTLEQMPERLSEARTAWQDFVAFADGNAAIASPAIGRARMQAIDAIVELDRVSAEVRERAAQRAQSSQSQ